MSAPQDIAVQVPTEYSIAFELARLSNALIGPNQKGKNSKKDFTLWIQRGVEVKCDFKSKERELGCCLP